MISKLEERAKRFATYHHRNQTRKYQNLPYIVHPEAVANIIRTINHSEEMIAASWLHDVVEDCDVTLEDIEKEFGQEVRDLVEMLTDVSKPSDGNRKIRKAIDHEHSAKASPDGQTIKVADLIHNSLDILQNDKNFARVFLKEKKLLLKVLDKADKILLDRAYEILKNGYIELYGDCNEN